MRRHRAAACLSNAGSYALVFECAQGGSVSVGALGKVHLRPGYLVYIGSAFGSGGLIARLRHHIRPVERPHWHIDYLRQSASLVGAWCANGPRSLEHLWAASFSELRGFTTPKPGFGSSDCDCRTHLLHARWRPTGRRTRDRLSRANAGADAHYFELAELTRSVQESWG